MSDPAAGASGLSCRELTVNGHRVRVAEHNVAARASDSLVIFNGIGTPIEVLEPFITALGSHHVVTLDMPGVGASSVPLLPQRMRHYATTAAGVLQQLNMPAANIMGISWGGMLAQQFAVQFPNRTRRLILAATSAGQMMLPPGPVTLLRMAAPLRLFSPDWFEHAVAGMYGGDFRKRGNGLARRHAGYLVAARLPGYALQAAALWGWTSLHQLRGLPMPTLIMAGQDDPIIPSANAHMMARLIPDARLAMFDCGHLFVLTRTARAVATIEAFLAGERVPDGDAANR